MFSRHNAIWSHVSSFWGFTIAPWVIIGVIDLVLLGWLAYGAFIQNDPGFRVPQLLLVKLHEGIAPNVKKDEPSPKPEEEAPKTKFQVWRREAWELMEKWGTRILHWI